MKYCVLMLLALMVSACGINKTYVGKPTGTDPNFVTDPAQEVLSITAEKTYHPSSNKNGEHEVDSFLEVELPSTLTVVSGNAGNYWAFLDFDDLRCFYKGGSNFSYPLQMASQEEVQKGQKYHLQYCEDDQGYEIDVQAGDLVAVSYKITLTIHNGDSTEPTVVKAEFPLN